MPPPHQPSQHPASNAFGTLSRLLLCAAVVMLAGCASQPRQTADNSSLHMLRDAYLIQAQSDPLAAWLESADQLALDRARRMDYPGGSASYPAPAGSGRSLVTTAMRFLGVKYRYGGDSPGEGFDCSGLVAYAAEKSLGLKLPRRAREIAREGISVDRDELRRGDLVFFNTLGHRFSHVGIYLGDQKFVHAPRAGSRVRVENMDIAYWRKRYNGARRLEAGTRTAALAESSAPPRSTPSAAHPQAKKTSTKAATRKVAARRR